MVCDQAVAPCPPATWTDFRLHVGICLGVWFVLSVSCFMMGTCRRSWHAERVESLLFSPAHTMTTNKIYLALAAAVALMICVLHVLRTARGSVDSLWDNLETYFCLFYAVEMLIVLVHTTARSTQELFSMVFGRLVVDSFLLPSVLIRGLSQQESLFSFSYTASLRILCVQNSFHDTLTNRNDVVPQIALAASTLSNGVFWIAALIMQVETLSGEQWDPLWIAGSLSADTAVSRVWTLSSSVYYILVSVLTIGYGDLRVNSILGEIIAALSTVVGIWLMLRTVLGTLQAIVNGVSGGGSYAAIRRSRHAFVAGSPSLQVLRDFVSELYHEDHASESDGLNLVIMMLPGHSSVIDGMQTWLRQKENRRLRYRIWMIQGSALRQEDLRRANYHKATMGFLLPNLYAADGEMEDLENITRALNMRRHAPHVRVITLLRQIEHMDVMLSTGVGRGDIICADELKQGLLGKSCEVNGFATMACTLYKSAGSHELLDSKGYKPPWVDDYGDGLENELYEMPLSPSYFGAPFGDVALDVLARSNGAAYLVGLIEDPLYPGDETITVLYPGRHYKVGIREDRECKGIFIAHDRETIVQSPPGKHFGWHYEEEKGAASAAAEAMPHLPNVVPLGDATAERFGWVRTDQQVDEDGVKRVLCNMQRAAALHTSQGVRQLTKMSRQEVDDLLGIKFAPKVNPGGGTAMLQNMLKQTSNPQEQEGLKEAIAAWHAEEKEAAMREYEEEAREEAKLKVSLKREVAEATQLEAQKRVLGRAAHKDREDDDLLWGGPQPEAPGHWGSPEEPPAWLLLRGGHVLVVCIQGQEISEAGADTSLPGPPLGLVHFLRSLRAGQRLTRSVVVISARVPADWAATAAEGDVYLVVGPPLASPSFRRGGIQQAHVVVIQQRSCAASSDPSTVDAEAVFACTLAESMAKAAGRDVPVICDLMLERNSKFVQVDMESDHASKKDVPGQQQTEEDEEFKQLEPEEKVTPFVYQPRFVKGQLFMSSVCTNLIANCLYNPSLGSVFREMIRSCYVVVPVPTDGRCHTFEELVRHLMKTRNLLPLALVRRMDISVIDDEDDVELEEQQHLAVAAAAAGGGAGAAGDAAGAAQHAPAAAAAAAGGGQPHEGAAAGSSLRQAAGGPSAGQPHHHGGAGGAAGGGHGAHHHHHHLLRASIFNATRPRWSPNDPKSKRYIYTMPRGNKAVDSSDGVLCILPTTGTEHLQPGRPREGHAS